MSVFGCRKVELVERSRSSTDTKLVLAQATVTTCSDIIHSGLRKYTKLACNSLKMIPNDTISQPIR